MRCTTRKWARRTPSPESAILPESEGRGLEGRSMNPSLGSRPAEPGATRHFVGTRFVRRLQVSIRDIVRSSCGDES